MADVAIPTEALANMAIAAPASMAAPANRNMPPARVRYLFKKLDTDNSGGLSLDELRTGFCSDLKVDALADHVTKRMEDMFEKHAVSKDGGEKALSAKVFARFYCDVLFRHFDKDNSGTLELAEVQEALKHMVKPNEDGVKVAPIVAFPDEFKKDGEVHLPLQWFWMTFSAMD